jgi:CBS domain-containing protein
MKTAAQLLKLKVVQNRQVHSIAPDEMMRDIMSSPVVTAPSQQSIERCMAVMTDSHLRHLPVVEDGELIGLLSIGDLVKEAIVEQADLIRQLEHYIRGH